MGSHKACRPQNENVDLSIRSESGSELVAAEFSFLSAPKMIAEENYHHAARRAPNIPLPGTPTIRGLGVNSPRGVNPDGLFVQWRRSEDKNAMVMLA
jgi:hypothetical protein